MDSHVAVLAAAGITPTVGVEADGVDRTKVPLHPRKLLLEHQVEETRVELPDTRGGCRHVHGLLPAPHDHVRMRVDQRGDGGGVDGSVGLVHFERFQVADVPEPGGGVLAGGDEHHAVVAELHVLDLLSVFLPHLDLWQGERDGGEAEERDIELVWGEKEAAIDIMREKEVKNCYYNRENA